MPPVLLFVSGGVSDRIFVKAYFALHSTTILYRMIAGLSISFAVFFWIFLKIYAGRHPIFLKNAEQRVFAGMRAVAGRRIFKIPGSAQASGFRKTCRMSGGSFGAQTLLVCCGAGTLCVRTGRSCSAAGTVRNASARFGFCGIPVLSAGAPDADISRNASHICAAPGAGLRNIGIGAPARGGAAGPVLPRGFPGLDAFAAPVPVRASGCGGPADGRRGAASMPVREKCRGHSREPPGRACGI